MVDAPLPQAPLVYQSDAEHRRLIAVRANGALPKGGGEPMTGPLKLFSVTVAGLSDYPASDYPGSLVYITDETGGPVPAYSDGTNWRRVSDGNVVAS